MLRPPVRRFSTTQSIAAMTCDTSVAPCESATLTLTRRASGATPTKRSSPFSTGRSTALSRPAMMPAMWVPCP